MFSKNWASILFTTLVLSVAALMQLPGSLKAQSLPDLSVTAFTIEKDAVCVAKFTVVNSGPEVLQEIHIYGDQVFDQYLKIVLPEGEFKSEVNFQKGCPKDSAEIVVDATNMVVELDESDESNKKWICIPCIVTPTPTSTSTATFVPTATSVVTNTQILVLEPQSSITETFVVLVSPGGEYKWHAWVNGEFCWGVNVFNGGFKLLTCDLGIQSIESIEFHVLKNLQEDVVLATATWPLPTATPTNTPVPSTSTATNTPVPATATATSTSVPATATATNTPVPVTATATNTPVPSTSTATNTPVPSTSTATNTPEPWYEIQLVGNSVEVIGQQLIVHGYKWSGSTQQSFFSYQFGVTGEKFVWSPDSKTTIIEIIIDPDNLQGMYAKYIYQVVNGLIQRQVFLPVVSSNSNPPLQPTPQVASEG